VNLTSTKPGLDLPTFCQRLHDRYEEAPSYQDVWRAAVGRRFVAERIGGRWRIPAGAEERAEGEAVAAFGLKPKSQPVAA
jgi:hypothetical protein